ncbi:asparagine synthase (glutamine-hydrolyzing) [Marininema halotolerans]|uniref:asparagine synthase (glutamine-hydrolyzing) n=1 Tax=Marininema halotolerans TaxID=1155944 RepID=A0A1I6Q3G6_9BACL|nr:asparagine synthase (glutamine-hydrolyzing) [Marininema halotolerans]SFS46987.1 asparagine synthase (glutamine-hydrolysing) [Marininema halotolerans]
MCGITGWVDWNRDLSNEKPTLEKMANSIYWRGPDNDGFWLSQRVAFAHRRLIVIDPEGGVQPMVRRERGAEYALTYNGELYNFRELREELRGLGHTFETRSDTEVVLRSYIEWGSEAPRRFNGIFAAAIWDGARQELVLIRDQLGVKPLFYAQRNDSIIFGSELKALLSHPSIDPAIGRTGLAELFITVPVRTPGHGIYQDVHEVRPGYLLRFSATGVKEERYWKLESHPHEDDLEKTTLHIRELLHDTVQRQLIADVPVVSLLSGGLDSSGLTALAAREYREQGKEPLHTYSVDFVGSDRDFQADPLHQSLDAPWIERMVKHTQSNHHTVTLDTPDLIANHDVPIHAHDLPGMGEMEISLYMLFREIRKNAVVTLSGESADEVFGGYPWFHDEKVLQAKTFPWNVTMESNHNQMDLFTPEINEVLHREEYLQQRYEEAISEVPKLPGESAHDARIRELFYLNLTRFLPVLLNRKDRMSMATGLEVRVPFCDPRLVQYVWNIPWEMKNVDGMEKGILRRAFADVLPEGVVKRKKSAYPFTTNPTYLAALRSRMEEIINDTHSPLTSIIQRSALQNLLNATATPSQKITQWIQILDRLVQTDTWLREYQVSIRL